MKRPELIPDWRRAWRFLSVQIAAAGVIFGSLPSDTQAAMLDAVGLPASRLHGRPSRRIRHAGAAYPEERP